MYKLLGPFTQLLPLTGHANKGAIKDEDLKVVLNAGILIKEGRIEAIDNFEKLVKSSRNLKVAIEELRQPQVGMPGMIDCHTHICFGGSRAKDYALRNAGKTYLEIAKSGGGIWDTVQQTRKQSQAELTTGIIKRANRQLKNGITTIEVKSGYGLSVKEELKMLRAIQAANQESVADLVSTCLAAHIFPKDYDGTISDYLAEISSQLFPILKAEKLSNRIDAFIEEEAFSNEIISPYLAAAKKMGFDITIHADQFHPSGSEVAIKFKAVSADHLEASTDKEIALLANSNVMPVALPGASIGIGCPFTPARKLLDAGTGLAIASDWNPGSAPMGHLLTQAAILGTFEKLSNAEVLAGITFRAAAALNIKNSGQLKTDYKADIIAFPTNDYREILYQQGQLTPNKVWKNGGNTAL
ncbi:MAG: imidazolonepropionase [Saprospiraceae bacterium]